MAKQNTNKRPKASSTPKAKMKVKFLKNPTALFKLCYSEGDEKEIDGNLAQELIEAGYAKELK